MRRFSALGAAAALLLTAAACGSSDGELSAADIRRELSANFQSGEDGLTKEQADCYADLIIEKVGVDKLKDIDLSADTPPATIQDAVSAASDQAIDECGLAEGG